MLMLVTAMHKQAPGNLIQNAIYGIKLVRVRTPNVFSNTGRSRGGTVGFTLIEMVITIVILSIALAALSGVLSNGISRSGDTLLQVRAVALAQSYLDEILGKRYDERAAPRGVPPCRDPAVPGVPGARVCTPEVSFGPDGGETPGSYSRERWDDVDDYHGMDEGEGAVNPLLDADGNLRTDYENFRVQVSVRYINLGISVPVEDEEVGLPVNNELDDEYDAKLIVVTVTNDALGGAVDYSAFKANF